MNSTKWPSLTEFAKHLGREGICRVEDTDKGLHISWIDDSPEALRRRDALKRKEAQDQGDEELEQRMIREQIRRAQAAVGGGGGGRELDEDEEDDNRGLTRQGDEKITLSFGARKAEKPEGPESKKLDEPQADQPTTASDTPDPKQSSSAEPEKGPAKPAGFGGMSIKLGGKPQTKNVFASKKNALGGGPKKTAGAFEPPKKMSEAERIMKEEMERKRSRQTAGFGMPGAKKHKSG